MRLKSGVVGGATYHVKWWVELHVEWWVGLPCGVVGGAAMRSGGWGCHAEWWVGLPCGVVGGAAMRSGGWGSHVEWWVGLPCGVVGGAACGVVVLGGGHPNHSPLQYRGG